MEVWRDEEGAWGRYTQTVTLPTTNIKDTTQVGGCRHCCRSKPARGYPPFTIFIVQLRLQLGATFHAVVETPHGYHKVIKLSRCTFIQTLKWWEDVDDVSLRSKRLKACDRLVQRREGGAWPDWFGISKWNSRIRQPGVSDPVFYVQIIPQKWDRKSLPVNWDTLM